MALSTWVTAWRYVNRSLLRLKITPFSVFHPLSWQRGDFPSILAHQFMFTISAALFKVALIIWSHITITRINAIPRAFRIAFILSVKWLKAVWTETSNPLCWSFILDYVRRLCALGRWYRHGVCWVEQPALSRRRVGSNTSQSSLRKGKGPRGLFVLLVCSPPLEMLTSMAASVHS